MSLQLTSNRKQHALLVMATALLASNKYRPSLSWLLQLAQVNRAEFDDALKRYLYPRAPR